jgi:hypothetical protein
MLFKIIKRKRLREPVCVVHVQLVVEKKKKKKRVIERKGTKGKKRTKVINKRK